jgi:flagellar protein FliS
MLQQQTSPQPKNAHVAYKHASHNMTKTRQVVLAYDGIISMVLRARQAIQENDPETRFNSIQRACMVILSLQTALDHKNGGEIAKMLDSFYFSIDLRLMRQHTEQDIGKLDQLIGEIRQMRDAWVDVDAQMTNAKAQGTELPPAAPSAETISSISVNA